MATEMKIKTSTFFFLFGLAVSLSKAQLLACSCSKPLDAPGDMSKVDVVFVGQVIKGELKDRALEKGSYLSRDFELKVRETLKGKLESTVHIATGLGDNDCGFDFILGNDYLVYAYGSPQLETNMCAGTKKFYPLGKKEVEQLKRNGK